MTGEQQPSNGWSRAKVILSVILTASLLLAAVSGVIYAWGDVRHCAVDNSRRIDRLEQQLERIEDKLDRLLLDRGMDPDDEQ